MIQRVPRADAHGHILPPLRGGIANLPSIKHQPASTVSVCIYRVWASTVSGHLPCLGIYRVWHGHLPSKNPCQDFQPVANPLFPMRKISARLPILPAQKRPADAAVDHMKRLNLIVRKNLPPIHPWHRTTPLHPRPKNKHPLPRQNSIKTSVSFVK